MFGRRIAGVAVIAGLALASGGAAAQWVPGARDTYDNIMTWYERESDSLIMRPLIPLDEKITLHKLYEARRQS